MLYAPRLEPHATSSLARIVCRRFIHPAGFYRRAREREGQHQEQEQEQQQREAAGGRESSAETPRGGTGSINNRQSSNIPTIVDDLCHGMPRHTKNVRH